MSSDRMITASGRLIHLLSIKPEDIFIEDIASALSKLGRFTGHSREFISVAEHSVRVSRLVSEKYALWGLLHDASEAYLGDISRPLKYQPFMKGYRNLEAGLMATICERFNLSPQEPDEVKWADKVICATELRSLFVLPEGLELSAIPLPDTITPCPSPQDAELWFLHRYYQLTEKGSIL